MGVNDELLTKAGMQAARDALLKRFQWFEHRSPLINFPAIRTAGLELRNPGGWPPRELVAALANRDPGRMISLRVVGASYNYVHPRPGPLFAVALSRDDLPETIVLDWSYMGTWTLPQVIQETEPQKSAAQLFCDVVDRRGVISAYEPIAAAALTVCTKGQSLNDPSSWPRLSETDENDLLLIG